MMRKRLFCFTFLWLLYFTAHGEASVVVELSPEAVVSGKYIYLSEIAQVQGPGTGTASALGEMNVGPTPRPGEAVVVSRNRVVHVLRLGGVPVEDLELRGAPETVVRSPSQTVPVETVHQIVEEHILAHMPWEAKDVSIEQVRGARELVLPAGDVVHEVKPQPGCDYLGLTSFQVVTTTDGGEAVHQWVKADIRVTSPAVVARHPIPRLTEIGAADVKVEQRNLSSLSSDTVTSVDNVVGKRSRRAIGAGEPIRLGQVEVAPVVRRGDLVILKVESEHFMVTAKGKVLENGRPGEVIRAENIASRKEVYGKVLDGRTLLVDF